MEENKFLLTGIGIPIFDTYALLDDTSILKKYNLNLNSSTAVDKHVYEEILDHVQQKYQTFSSPGGCAQNTTRMFQWLESARKYKTRMYGSIGNDEQGQFLSITLHNEGVQVEYAILDHARTSASLLLVHNATRSIVLNIGEDRAGNKFKTVNQSYFSKLFSTIYDTEMLVSNAYFTYSSFEICKIIFAECSKRNIITAFGLCLFTFHSSDPNVTIMPFVESCRILAANRPEFMALCQHLQIDCSNLVDALKKVHQRTSLRFGKSADGSKAVKIIVITDDKMPVHCYDGQEYIRCPVPPLQPHEVKDTTGAGDAFLAGFLWAFSQRKPLLRCLEIANKTAAAIIQTYGCVLPKKAPNLI